MAQKLQGRDRRRKRIRFKITGTIERPRLSVFRSEKHIYAQVINDADGKTIASASTKADITDKVPALEKAKKVGALVAEKAMKSGVTKVVFDRGGYLYHGRVKALADGAREKGLKF